jgi:NADP-dependent 3-hydroxy acid dehydrogenase YdfG
MTTTRSSSTPHAPDSTALVAGATSGIGRTTAACLAARRHAVVVADRSSDRVTGIVEATAQFGDFIPTPARPQPGGSPRRNKSPPPV